MDTNIVKQIVEKEVKKLNFFLIECKISTFNKITVVMDSMNGISVNDCALLSKRINRQLSRDIEDYELEVSSMGIGKPFKVKQQYLKTLGNMVVVETIDRRKFKGKLLKVNTDFIEIEIEKKIKKDKNKSGLILLKEEINFDSIKTTKEVITL